MVPGTWKTRWSSTTSESYIIGDWNHNSLSSTDDDYAHSQGPISSACQEEAGNNIPAGGRLGSSPVVTMYMEYKRWTRLGESQKGEGLCTFDSRIKHTRKHAKGWGCGWFRHHRRIRQGPVWSRAPSVSSFKHLFILFNVSGVRKRKIP